MSTLRATRLVVLCGPAFSGKTTVAAVLAARGLHVVSLDAILRADGHEPATGLPLQRWHDAFDVATDRVRAALSAERTTVVDDTACYRFLRQHWRGVATSSGVAALLAVLIAPPALVRRRRADNLKALKMSPNPGKPDALRHPAGLRPHVVDEVFEPHLASFEWPDDSERPLWLPADAPVEATARAILAALAVAAAERSAKG